MSPLADVGSDAPKPAMNPFANSVFGNPLDESPTDVVEINAEAFQKCWTLVERVRSAGQTQALLLFGEPGSGKTHLLSRLRNRLEKGSQPSLFIPNKMMTTASMLWRFLRRNLTAALVRNRAFERVIKRSREEIGARDRNLGIVLGNLLDGLRYADSVAWLRGDDLPEDVLREMRLSAGRDEEEQEASSRRLVETICALGEPTPFVFCFDQLEALQSYRDDTEGYHKLGQVISDLHGETHNVAIVCCLQTSMIIKFDDALNDADRDRLNERSGLVGLTLEEAMKLIRARVDNVAELKGQTPIRANDIKDLFKDDLCVARKVIVRCQNLFEKVGPPEPIGKELERRLQNLLRTPRMEDAESILRVSLPSTLYLRGLKMALPARPDAAIDGVVQGKKRTAIAVANQKAGVTLINRLQKVQKDWQASGAEQLLILRDARNGIGVGAVRSREALAKIGKTGARVVYVKPEALAVLEAISRLLANARSGDLTYKGDSVPAATVEDWLRGAMPRAVDELLDEIGGDKEAAPDELAGMLMDLLAKGKVIEVTEAASALSKTAEEVEECARHNTSLMGFAGGSKRVLFRIVERQPTPGQRD